ncbi:hypothetical protein, partial [Gordonia sp. i37]|uniref:hypothetical protein n=1 Tax=Gordonia sp. i37 TaxID=1961707 RepID=UPI00209B636C
MPLAAPELAPRLTRGPGSVTGPVAGPRAARGFCDRGNAPDVGDGDQGAVSGPSGVGALGAGAPAAGGA